MKYNYDKILNLGMQRNDYVLNINDKRIILIKNRINRLEAEINSLNKEKLLIINKLNDIDELENYKINLNNLNVILSLLIFYSKQLKYLNNKFQEYFSISSNKDVVVRNRFMEFWQTEIDLFFNEPLDFNFECLNNNDDLICDSIIVPNKEKKLINS